jgi:hypothetical protein
MKKRYVDPLHVPYSQLVVVYKDKEVLMLNKSLLDQQNCWENLEEIKAAHVKKQELYDKLRETDDVNTLRALDQQLNYLENTLQRLWKFEVDGNYHRIWERPKCKCPELDNRDRYPHGHIISSACPLHGSLDDNGS